MIEAKRVNLMNVVLIKAQVPLSVRYLGNDAVEVIDDTRNSWYIGSIQQVEIYIAGAIKMHQVLKND